MRAVEKVYRLILDLDAAAEDLRHNADICIVGAGAAGVTIAQRFANTGVKVCLLESGGWDFEPETQALYKGFLTGHPMTLDVGRYRVMGGSTSKWTGRCGRMEAIDFAPRDWIDHSGWPISGADLEPYYVEAERVCGFSQAWEDDDSVLKRLGVATDSPAIAPFLWRYAPIGNRVYRNWGREYRTILETSNDIHLFTHANVTHFAVNENRDAVTSLHAQTLGGRKLAVEARHFVLACGGVENARLLLSTADYIPGGLGQAQDQIGRYFMQHPRGNIGRLKPTARAASYLQDHFNIFATLGGTQYETGFVLSPDFQREHQLLNSSVIMMYDADPSSGWEGFKSLIGAGEFKMSKTMAVLAIVKDPTSVIRNLWRRTVERRHANYPVRNIRLQIDLEQRPDSESRITLSDRRDRLGMPMVTVDWRLSDLERRTSRIFGEELQKLAREKGWGEVELEPWLYEDGSIKPENLDGTYHHLSCVRMASAPEYGAADENAKVFGVNNLYVAGAASFSTGGHVNPTFTIVALALRLADHLKNKLLMAASS